MKAIELLKKVRQWIMNEGGIVCPHKYGSCNHDNENCPVFCIDQAIVSLQSELADKNKQIDELKFWQKMSIVKNGKK